jgi:ubiquitin C-terminal hydrolase
MSVFVAPNSQMFMANATANGNGHGKSNKYRGNSGGDSQGKSLEPFLLRAEPLAFHKARSKEAGSSIETVPYKPINANEVAAWKKNNNNVDGGNRKRSSEQGARLVSPGNGKVTSKSGTDPVGPPLPEYRIYSLKKVRKSLKFRHTDRIGAGLRNCGNTCFANATLQSLMYLPPIYNYFHRKKHSASCPLKHSFCVPCALEVLFHKSMAAGGGAVTPSIIVGQLKLIGKQFRIGRQEDAHEFLRCLVDAWQAQCLKATGKKSQQIPHPVQGTTFVHAVFGGMLSSTVTCMSCHNLSSVYDPCLDISLEVKGSSSVSDAIRRYCVGEKLEPKSYACSNCNKRVDAEKRLDIHSLPSVLVLQLKRFGYSHLAKKLNKHLEFSPTLSIPSHDNVYDLQSVLVHEGSSASVGHYYTYVKGPNGMWYRMDDEFVKVVSINEVLNAQAYILFYIMRVEDTESPSSSQENPKSAKNHPSHPKRKKMKSPETALSPGSADFQPSPAWIKGKDDKEEKKNKKNKNKNKSEATSIESQYGFSVRIPIVTSSDEPDEKAKQKKEKVAKYEKQERDNNTSEKEREGEREREREREKTNLGQAKPLPAEFWDHVPYHQRVVQPSSDRLEEKLSLFRRRKRDEDDSAYDKGKVRKVKRASAVHQSYPEVEGESNVFQAIQDGLLPRSKGRQHSKMRQSQSNGTKSGRSDRRPTTR